MSEAVENPIEKKERPQRSGAAPKTSSVLFFSHFEEITPRSGRNLDRLFRQRQTSQAVGLRDDACTVHRHNLHALGGSVCNAKYDITIGIKRNRMSDSSADEFHRDRVTGVPGVGPEDKIVSGLFRDVSTESGITVDIIQRTGNRASADCNTRLQLSYSFAEHVRLTILGLHSETD